MMPPESPNERWKRLKHELSAYRIADAEVWGGMDDSLVARYIAGECSDAEKAVVQQLAARYPAVQNAIQVVSDALVNPQDVTWPTVTVEKLSSTVAPGRTGRPTRIVIGIASVVASVALGMVCAFMWNRSAGSGQFQLLAAQAEVRSLAARGGIDGRVVAIDGDRNGFATIVALFPNDPPLGFPSLGSGAIPVTPGTHVESPPLPPGFDDAQVIIVVITEQPSVEIIRGALDGSAFSPDQTSQLQQFVIEVLKKNNYHWASFKVLRLK